MCLAVLALHRLHLGPIRIQGRHSLNMLKILPASLLQKNPNAMKVIATTWYLYNTFTKYYHYHMITSKLGPLGIGVLHECIEGLLCTLFLLRSQSAIFPPCHIQIFKAFEIKLPDLSFISLYILKLFLQSSHFLSLLGRIHQCAFPFDQFLNYLVEAALKTTHKEVKHVESESV